MAFASQRGVEHNFPTLFASTCEKTWDPKESALDTRMQKCPKTVELLCMLWRPWHGAYCIAAGFQTAKTHCPVYLCRPVLVFHKDVSTFEQRSHMRIRSIDFLCAYFLRPALLEV